VLGRVLVVDDDPDINRLLRDLLSELGYVVKNAVNGRDGLRLADIFLPDVVLLDIAMPIMSGIEVLACLQVQHPSIRIVMMTGNQDAELARSTLARGAFDYLPKPIDFDVLERVLAAAVTASGNASGNQ
jgi:DNA-binding NtrC family response regulator